MILTGKALADFEAYYYSKPDYVGAWELLPKIYLHALIVEWFDTVRIHTSVFHSWDNIDNDATFMYKVESNDTIASNKISYTTRYEATEAALITANNMYNER